VDRCAYCDKRVGDRGVWRREELFCSRGCARRKHPPEFCDRCQRETTSQTTGNLSSVNGIGYTLMRVRGRKPCCECGSEIARVWFTFGFPIIPLSRYRVLWIDEPWYFGAEGSWLARKLR
jgi:hypothetical protein